MVYVDPSGKIREPGLNKKGEFSQDPDAYDYGKNSDTYKILLDLGNRWAESEPNSIQRTNYAKMASEVRTAADNGTPMKYGNDEIMRLLHKNVAEGLIELDYATEIEVYAWYVYFS